MTKASDGKNTGRRAGPLKLDAARGRKSSMRVNAVKAALVGLAIVSAAWRPIPAQEPSAAESSKASAKPKDSKQAISAAVDQLVEQLRRHPPEPSKAADRVAGLYMIDVSTGEVTLVADQPNDGVTFCGSPAWSNDGKRILFDAMRTTEVQLSRLKSIELIGGQLRLTDLGVGNCPTFSPAGDRIAFWLNPGGVPGAEAGVWLMQTDGSQRRLLGSFGRPKWSPDSRQFMLIDFAIPADVTMMDVRPEKERPPAITRSAILLGTELGERRDDRGSRRRRIRRHHRPDRRDQPTTGENHRSSLEDELQRQGPRASVRSTRRTRPRTGRCVFIGKENEGMALYSFRRGHADPPKRLEPEGLRLTDAGRGLVAGWPVRRLLQQSSRPAAARVRPRRRCPRRERRHWQEKRYFSLDTIP